MDDTLCYIKTDSIEYVLNISNGFHRNTQFTYKVEKDSKTSFLDLLVIRDLNSNINTIVYRKGTNNDIYLAQVAYTGKNLSTCFNVKDQGRFGHQHEVVCYADRPNEHGCRISERIKDHNGRYLKS